MRTERSSNEVICSALFAKYRCRRFNSMRSMNQKKSDPISSVLSMRASRKYTRGLFPEVEQGLVGFDPDGKSHLPGCAPEQAVDVYEFFIFLEKKIMLRIMIAIHSGPDPFAPGGRQHCGFFLDGGADPLLQRAIHQAPHDDPAVHWTLAITMHDRRRNSDQGAKLRLDR